MKFFENDIKSPHEHIYKGKKKKNNEKTHKTEKKIHYVGIMQIDYSLNREKKRKNDGKTTKIKAPYKKILGFPRIIGKKTYLTTYQGKKKKKMMEKQQT